MTPDMIRRLPDWLALVIRGGLAPVIARLPMAWKDRTYRQAARAGCAVATLTPAPVAASLVVAGGGGGRCAGLQAAEPGLAWNGHCGSGGGQDYAWSRGDD